MCKKYQAAIPSPIPARAENFVSFFERALCIGVTPLGQVRSSSGKVIPGSGPTGAPHRLGHVCPKVSPAIDRARLDRPFKGLTTGARLER